MALPTGTFTTTRSGRLQVVFSGTWLVDEADWGAGDWQLSLRAYVGTGATRKTSLLGTNTATATIEVDYVAGTDVAVGFEYDGHSFGGAGTICATDLRIACHLLAPHQRPRVVTFSGLLALLSSQIRPMSAVPTTPRWMPDADSGTEWYVRPLSAMATNDGSADRYLSENVEEPLTGFANHPLAADRTADPIDPGSVVAVGYASMDWTGDPVPMKTEVLTEITTFGYTVYYIRATGGPLIWNPTTEQWAGTVRITWKYGAVDVLNGTTYATAWPGLPAVKWVSGTGVAAGDTLWICGTHYGAGLTVGESGTAGAYIKLRLDHATDPGRIDKAAFITTEWTAEGSEWWTPLLNVSECMVYEGEQRLVGCNIRSRCRSPISAVNPDANTISFANIRRVDTGSIIDIASDFVGEKLPAGITQNTRYYAIVVSSPWISNPAGTFYGVLQHAYVVKLAATYEDAMAGIAIDLGARGSEPPPNAFVFVRQTTDPFFDPVPGALAVGEYAVDVVQQRLYHRPATGGSVRVSAETYGGDSYFGAVGSCIYGYGRSYIKVLGGGQYGGLFADTPAPAGRLGLGNSNVIEFDTGQHIVVDGVYINGGRSGVTFKDIQYGTVRNSRIKECAHHACGGEDLTGTQEPDLLLERNWISHIGNLHEFGDAQSLVTNPHCDRAIYRRNYVQHLGDNKLVSNPAGAVFDGSEAVVCYLNWFDDCNGKTFEMAAGTADPPTRDPVVLANVVTRQGQGLTRAENLLQRVGMLHLVLNGLTDPGVVGARCIGNLVAWATIGNRAPGTLDDCGLIYQRSNNNAGTGQNQVTFERNAVLACDGPVWSQQKNSTALLWPERTANFNLYATVPEWAIKASSGTILQTWSGGQIVGGTAGQWTFDTGQELNSELAVHHPADIARGPTLAELEILRRFDAYDTYEQPDTDSVSGFPLAPL